MVAVIVVALVALIIGLRHPMPEVVAGADADALAHELVKAVDGEAWERTGAVRWRLPGRAHLWDRQHGLARVEWRDQRVLFDINRKTGRAWRGGSEVTDGDERQKLVDKAYALWVNDSFWLNPVVKAFDDGTTRARGTVDKKRALLVSYTSGGLTPGDKYLWIVGDDGRPAAWRLWVGIIKLVPGLQFTWEGWTRLATGAWVATSHKALGIDVVPIRDLAAAATLGELDPSDPFAPLR